MVPLPDSRGFWITVGDHRDPAGGQDRRVFGWWRSDP
jgi:hypothetical protein